MAASERNNAEVKPQLLQMHRRDFVKISAAAACCAVGEPLFSLVREPDTLQAAGARRHIHIGSAVGNHALQNAVFTRVVAQQCNMVVPENLMKWTHVHPEADRYDFGPADEVMAFAEKNSMLVRGTNLCWHEAWPEWLTETATAQNAQQLLEEHIRTVAGRYMGRIHSWDVVNEAIEPYDKRPDGLRNSPWLQLLGPSYIEMAFRAAAQADPRALLTYNEYGLEDDTQEAEQRRSASMSLLRWMRTNKIPIHALGLQSHLIPSFETFPDWTALRHFLKETAELGLQVFVTEFDIDDTALDETPEKREKLVAALCRDYLENIVKHKNVTAVLTWGLANHLGSNGDRVDLPFDQDFQPTPFFAAMVEALRTR